MEEKSKNCNAKTSLKEQVKRYPVRLLELHLLNFKSFKEASVLLDSDVTCFSGFNGEGKTNMLDAIRYLSMCKSYFNAADYQNINHDEESFLIKGTVKKHEEKDLLTCAVSRASKKVFKRNKKEYQRLSDHIGLYPSVMISPTDEDLIKEGSEIRRRFINGIIAQYDKSYLNDMVQYKRALNQRNRLLKHFQLERRFDAESLEIYDFKLIELNQRIFEKRQKFISEFKPWFQNLHEQISGNKEKVSLEYKTSCNANLPEQFKASLEKDKFSARTNVGVHKDDLEFTIGTHPIKKFGSQGQQKTFLIALKLGQSLFMEEATGLKPFLLLDDIFDKLDEQRVANLMKLVSENKFGQIFITDTDDNRVPELFKNLPITMNTYRIDSGNITAL